MVELIISLDQNEGLGGATTPADCWYVAWGEAIEVPLGAGCIPSQSAAAVL